MVSLHGEEQSIKASTEPVCFWLGRSFRSFRLVFKIPLRKARPMVEPNPRRNNFANIALGHCNTSIVFFNNNPQRSDCKICFPSPPPP